MKGNSKIFIIAGVVLSLVAGGLVFFLLNGAVQQQESAAPRATPTPLPPVEVVVLAQDVKAGTLLTGEMLKREARPAASVTPDDVRDMTEAVDRLVVAEGKLGQAIKRGDLQALPFVLPKGKKAMAIMVDDLSTVAGLIRERDYIDVVISGKIKLASPEGQTGQGGQGAATRPAGRGAPAGGEEEELAAIQPVGDQTVVKSVLQRVQVLKIIAPAPPPPPAGQRPNDPPPAATPVATPTTQAPQGRMSNAKTIVVLAVTNQEAELIRFTNDTGGLQLLLRGRDDSDREETKGMTLDILIRDYGLPVPRPVVVDIRKDEQP